MGIALISILVGTFLNSITINPGTPPPPPSAPIAEEPQKSQFEVIRDYIGEITGYSSREEETDSTPFITASGKRVAWGTLATNAYPFGTLVRFPDAFGDHIFMVEDRMNQRYKNRIDIWFPDQKKALRFGIQKTRVQIIKEPPERVASL